MRIAISPCPNDTFLYEALAREDASTGGAVEFLDIAELNALANHPDGPDLIKVSCAAAPRFLERYTILPAGGAFSDAVGPLVVRPAGASEVLPNESSRVGLPGFGTSAHLLWRMWLESRDLSTATESFHRFDLLPAACARREIDFAVVIHESRFTFRESGLEEVQDLGKFWDETTHLPVPLGCLLCRRDRGETFATRALASVRESLRDAWARPEATTAWIREHAQEMSESVQRQHIATYVTPRSLDCGEDGLRAMERLWTLADRFLGGAGSSPESRHDALEEARRRLLRS